MRLIDADALIKSTEIFCDMYEVKWTIGKVRAWIGNAPTIEAEPAKRGRWEDRPSGHYGRWQSWCSACGKHSGIGGIESDRHKPYCPNCGAKMDLEG